MDLAIVVAVYPIIFLGELPDKTMFASLIMSTKGKPLSVWLGAAGAFVVHVVIATTVGVGLFDLLPRRAVDGVVAALFVVGAGYAFVESRRGGAEDAQAGAPVKVVRGAHVVTTAFVVIFLAEWGDLTQILTANLAVRYHAPLSVGLGAILALWSVAAIAVVGGQGLLRYVNIATVRRATAVVLLGLAAYATWSALR